MILRRRMVGQAIHVRECVMVDPVAEMVQGWIAARKPHIGHVLVAEDPVHGVIVLSQNRVQISTVGMRGVVMERAAGGSVSRICVVASNPARLLHTLLCGVMRHSSSVWHGVRVEGRANRRDAGGLRPFQRRLARGNVSERNGNSKNSTVSLRKMILASSAPSSRRARSAESRSRVRYR